MRRQRNQDFGRPIMIDICKDGTISYRPRGRRPFNGVALPVFSVDTEEQARDIQVRFCRLQYTRHPMMLDDEPWYRWSGFDGQLESLEDVRKTLRKWYGGSR